jgi:hypothetical protein
VSEHGGLLSKGFTGWLAAETVSALGTRLMYFAVAWTATGISGRLAGVLFTIGVLPQLCLLLYGGAASDRWGLRRTLIGCDVAMCVLLAGAWLRCMRRFLWSRCWYLWS